MDEKIKYLVESGFGVDEETGEYVLNEVRIDLRKLGEVTFEEFMEVVNKSIATELSDEEENPEDMEPLPFEMEIESDQYTYLAEELKSIPTPIIFRASTKSGRFYYEIEDGMPVLYASGTTLISDGFIDPSGALDEWRLKQRILGNDPDEMANHRAAFGTIMHVLFGHYFLGKSIPLSPGILREYIKGIPGLRIEQKYFDMVINNDIEELIADMYSFVQWVNDYNVKPLAVEKMLRSKTYGFATAVDLICELDFKTKERGFFGKVYQRATKDHKAGDPMEEERVVTRRIVAVVDFKSGKSFYDGYVLQLEANRRLVIENYGDALNVEKIYNFAPRPNSATPYSFVDQTDKDVIEFADCVFEQGRLRHIRKDPKIKCYKNVVAKFGEELKQGVYSISLLEYLSNVRDFNTNGDV